MVEEHIGDPLPQQAGSPSREGEIRQIQDRDVLPRLCNLSSHAWWWVLGRLLQFYAAFYDVFAFLLFFLAYVYTLDKEQQYLCLCLFLWRLNLISVQRLPVQSSLNTVTWRELYFHLPSAPTGNLARLGILFLIIMLYLVKFRPVSWLLTIVRSSKNVSQCRFLYSSYLQQNIYCHLVNSYSLRSL